MKLLPFLTSQFEAGCDEAGRGCLAGPVVAAAVILPEGYSNKRLNDSKKIPEKIRNKLRLDIENKAKAIGIGIVDEKKIDQINILQASLLAMHIAIKNLNIVPTHLIIDGNKFNAYPNIKHDCIIKGDSKFMNIAAASIIAKTKTLTQAAATSVPLCPCPLSIGLCPLGLQVPELLVEAVDLQVHVPGPGGDLRPERPGVRVLPIPLEGADTRGLGHVPALGGRRCCRECAATV